MAKKACGNDSKSEPCHGECFRCLYTGQAFYKFPECENPTRAQRLSDSAYVPKLDICAGFTAPRGFAEWLAELANVIGKVGVAHFPILYALQSGLIQPNDLFVPLLGIEIETSVNKHLSGGIFNLAKNTYIGIVVADDPKVHKFVEFYRKELGIKNVAAYCVQ